MILEALITTRTADGRPHLAPMGPLVRPDMQSFVLRPYPTSRTYGHLCRHGEGVLHVSDDVLLFARAAVDALDPFPPCQPAQSVAGFVLTDCCRWYEFRVTDITATEPRVRIDCEVMHRGWVRDFFGFNRAKHAVVEAAILATRTAFLPRDEIRAEYRRLASWVEKTGGPAEREAFAFLQAVVERGAEERS